MDQGVIKSIKGNYQKCVLLLILDCLEKNKVGSMNVVNAIHFLDTERKRTN